MTDTRDHRNHVRPHPDCAECYPPVPALSFTAAEVVEGGTEYSMRLIAAKIDCGKRAAVVLNAILPTVARHLTDHYGEINDVLVEARRLGWLDE